MYTITVKKFGENEPFMINVPTPEIASELGKELAVSEQDIEKVVITLDQSKHFVKSQLIYLKPFEFGLVSSYKHTLDFFDWRNN